MDKYWFVDENFNTLRGEDARTALNAKSDAIYLTKNRGITKVPRDRWDLAQKFELTGWMEKWRKANDDRNYEHMDGFEKYKVLRKHKFTHAIELGCGPFTNLRLIARTLRIERCTLLDPLIELYFKHENCSYTKNFLKYESAVSLSLNKSKPLKIIKKILGKVRPKILYKDIPIEKIIPSSIEEMTIRDKYDLIILINVIEHCFDVELVFKNILKMAAPNAIFIFHDKLYEHKKVSELVNGHYYEAGHPLMVDHKLIYEFIENKFYKESVKKVEREISYIPVMPKYEGLYFIGRFK